MIGSSAPHAPGLVCLVGPPAVGKMTVGTELAGLTGMRLFHNHMSIEPALRFFAFGTPSFNRIVGDFRRAVFEEVATSDLPGLIFTFVWAFDIPTEATHVEQMVAPFRDRGGQVHFVELLADLDERLRRNTTDYRLAEKPSKRDVEASRQRLMQHESRHTFLAPSEFTARSDWLRIDTTQLSPSEVASAIVRRFALPSAQATATPSL